MFERNFATIFIRISFKIRATEAYCRLPSCPHSGGCDALLLFSYQCHVQVGHDSGILYLFRGSNFYWFCFLSPITQTSRYTKVDFCWDGRLRYHETNPSYLDWCYSPWILGPARCGDMANRHATRRYDHPNDAPGHDPEDSLRNLAALYPEENEERQPCLFDSRTPCRSSR